MHSTAEARTTSEVSFRLTNKVFHGKRPVCTVVALRAVRHLQQKERNMWTVSFNRNGPDFKWLQARKGQSLRSASCAMLILRLAAVEFMK